MKVVIYRRLSKEDRAKTQHGFDSQLADIQCYLSTLPEHEVVGDFYEFISGAADNKPELQKAMKICREQKAILVVAKLDRLSRRVSQIAQYMESDVKFRVARMPNAENLQLHIFASLAEAERKDLRDRTKRACAVAKAKGIRSGRASPNYGMNSGNGHKVIEAVLEARREQAKAKTEYVVPHIHTALKYLGKRPTQAKVAQFLNDANVSTPNGKNVWTQSAVCRILDKHNINLFA